ncbi:hypothetical protein BDK51DRAFT_26017 [Blyttiomyces helicus]|uniref:Uncharacterized protein n=1 Tax=Blyttiomyces helicus TaxID=388810 RepID=A0A4P9W4C7_9FUNG|nr:hypothetical protein BDK51DRAFT_26017 [Blyttiomyces helicus]|eukprot:RKO87201.1 hypothetical protein BDK51DRAFT_26017 [Blyttiomyces helicus]
MGPRRGKIDNGQELWKECSKGHPKLPQSTLLRVRQPDEHFDFFEVRTSSHQELNLVSGDGDARHAQKLELWAGLRDVPLEVSINTFSVIEIEELEVGPADPKETLEALGGEEDRWILEAVTRGEDERIQRGERRIVKEREGGVGDALMGIDLELGNGRTCAEKGGKEFGMVEFIAKGGIKELLIAEARQGTWSEVRAGREATLPDIRIKAQLDERRPHRPNEKVGEHSRVEVQRVPLSRDAQDGQAPDALRQGSEVERATRGQRRTLAIVLFRGLAQVRGPREPLPTLRLIISFPKPVSIRLPFRVSSLANFITPPQVLFSVTRSRRRDLELHKPRNEERKVVGGVQPVFNVEADECGVFLNVRKAVDELSTKWVQTRSEAAGSHSRQTRVAERRSAQPPSALLSGKSWKIWRKISQGRWGCGLERVRSSGSGWFEAGLKMWSWKTRLLPFGSGGGCRKRSAKTCGGPEYSDTESPDSDTQLR